MGDAKQAQGLGLLIDATGGIRHGLWSQSGLLSGAGVLVKASTTAIFAGQLHSKTIKNGIGYEMSKDGSFKQGTFRDDILLHGTGRIQVDDGTEVYEGELIKDIHEGFGRLVKDDGFFQEGRFRKGKDAQPCELCSSSKLQS